MQRWIQGEAWGHAPSQFFVVTCFYTITLKNYELLFEVKLIINNALLAHVYPDTIKTCLTPSHLLFGRQLLYSSNTTSAVVRNLTIISSTTNKINRISNHFWDRWRHEYVVNLRETQWTSKLNMNSPKINIKACVCYIFASLFCMSKTKHI